MIFIAFLIKLFAMSVSWHHFQYRPSQLFPSNCIEFDDSSPVQFGSFEFSLILNMMLVCAIFPRKLRRRVSQTNSSTLCCDIQHLITWIQNYVNSIIFYFCSTSIMYNVRERERLRWIRWEVSNPPPTHKK